MIEQTNQEIFRFLEPVEKLPLTKRRKPSFYDEIISEFIESGLKYAEVKETGRAPETVQIMLSQRLKEKQLTFIKARIRNKKVYLERVDAQEKTLCDFVDKNYSLEEAPPSEKTSLEDIKPIIDVMRLLNSLIIKVRCPKCKALNTKDAYRCRECNHNFYKNEEEYRESLRSIEKLEKELNSKEKST